MKSKSIFFRADGNASIGLGHIVRCLALAEMLKNTFSIVFYCREAPESIQKNIITLGFGFVKITNEDEFLQDAKSVIVVLDGYDFTSGYQKKLKGANCKVVCIDDLHDKEFFADLIINHAPDITKKDYNAQPYTKFALGLQYAMLRPLFLEAATTYNKQDNNNVLICFGGADPDNLTLKAINAVLKSNKFDAINVVTGTAYIYTATLKNIDSNKIKIHVNLTEQEMCAVMKSSALAIVPSSSVLIEAIACGIPIITCYYTDNQKDFHDAMVRRGIVTTGKVTDNYEEALKVKLKENNIASPEYIRKDFLNVRDNYISQFKLLV